jgi:uncharacterized DUF497 family protein
VRITFDPAKRATTLEGRGLDFAAAAHVFAGPTYTIRDERLAYPEPEGRFIAAGFLATRMVNIRLDADRGWTSHHFDEEGK